MLYMEMTEGSSSSIRGRRLHWSSSGRDHVASSSKHV